MPELAFRCYTPQHPDLQAYCLPGPKIEELERTIDDAIEEALTNAVNQDFFKLITPSQENADLKRILSKKIVMSERLTSKALKELRKKNSAQQK